MFRQFLFCIAPAALLIVNFVQTDKSGTDKPTTVTITKVDAQKGEITAKYEDENGKSQTKTLHLTRDVRLLDETGRVVQLDVFESGNDALVLESGGKVVEVRRTPHHNPTRNLSDAVQSLIEMSQYEEGFTQELQQIYDMLRKLDTGKNGQIDPK